MTTNEIKVGKKYINKEMPNATFLGIGFRKMWTGSFDNTGEMEHKHLVIIEDKDSSCSSYVGLVFKEGEDCSEGYWDNFVEL